MTKFTWPEEKTVGRNQRFYSPERAPGEKRVNGQDGGPSSPEIENSLQFLSGEYDDLKNLNTAAKQKTRYFHYTI